MWRSGLQTGAQPTTTTRLLEQGVRVRCGPREGYQEDGSPLCQARLAALKRHRLHETVV